MQAWQSVKAKPTHPRGGDDKGEGGQAGVIQSVNDKKTTADVKWDIDGETETVKLSELTALS